MAPSGSEKAMAKAPRQPRDQKYYESHRTEISAKNAARNKRDREKRRAEKERQQVEDLSKYTLASDLPPSSPPSPSGSSPPRTHSRHHNPRTPIRNPNSYFPEIGSPASSSTSEDDRTLPSFEFDTPARPRRLCHRHHAPSLDGSLQILREVRIMTEAWMSRFGPLAEWPRLFQKRYDEACESGQEPTAYLKAVEAHALEGREILRLLRGSPVICPPASHAAWGDYLAAGDLLDSLYHGVSMLEVRLDLLAPRVPRSAEMDSEIRHWDSLSGLVMGRSYFDIAKDDSN